MKWKVISRIVWGGNGKKDVTQNEQLIFKNMLIYETKSTVSFPKPTDTDAKQTITDAKPTVLL